MIIILCVDDNNGMMFNRRRQSQDRVLREDLLKLVGTGRLRMNAYSKKQFTDFGAAQAVIGEDYLDQAENGDFCFVEDKEVRPYEDQAERIILYRWNRVYPADFYFTLDLQGWTLEEMVEFAGSSHEKITREMYRR